MAIPGGIFTPVTLQSAAVATGAGTVVQPLDAPVGAFTFAVLQVQGITTATVTWQGTVDGSNYKDLVATNLSTGADATTATADGIFRLTVIGLAGLRANITAWTTGAVTVSGYMVT